MEWVTLTLNHQDITQKATTNFLETQPDILLEYMEGEVGQMSPGQMVVVILTATAKIKIIFKQIKMKGTGLSQLGPVFLFM